MKNMFGKLTRRKTGISVPTLCFALLLSAFVGTGCDGLRRLAGRPTSADLAEMQAALDLRREAEREAAAYQTRIDSLRRVEQAIADSLAVLDSLRQMRGTILNPSAMGGLFTTRLDYRYYIVVGAFTMRSNAEALLVRVQKAGYTGTLISFRNGYNAIGICQTDHLPTAFASLKKVRTEEFCPPDVWILVNE